MLHAVFQAERDSERFALYARKAALDERAEEIRQQLKVGASHGAMQGAKMSRCVRQQSGLGPAVQISVCGSHQQHAAAQGLAERPAHMHLLRTGKVECAM